VAFRLMTAEPAAVFCPVKRGGVGPGGPDTRLLYYTVPKAAPSQQISMGYRLSNTSSLSRQSVVLWLWGIFVTVVEVINADSYSMQQP